MFAVVGGWGANLGGASPGLSVFRVDLARRSAEPTDVVSLVSPSFVVAHSYRPWVFTATEEEPSTVLSYALDARGRLSLRSAVDGLGAGACHLALSPDGQHLVVAHYGSGAVTSFPVDADGVVGTALDVHAFTGSGPDAARQGGPHAHQALWVNDELLVCDLGTDRVHRLRLDADGRVSVTAQPLRLPAGSGPRHAAVIDNLLVVVLELSAEIWAGRRTADGWSETQRLPASVSDVPNLPSGIAAAGDRVFVANRGPDTVTDLTVQNARLTRAGEYAAGAPTPRDLRVCGSYLWVANQDANEITVLEPERGRPVLRLPVATPTTVAFLPS